MSKTVMQSHLEWLKRRCLIAPQVEAELLAEEKQQIIDFADSYGFHVCGYDYDKTEEYYNLKFKDDEK